MIDSTGQVLIEGNVVGRFDGLRFLPDATALKNLATDQLEVLEKTLQDECVRRMMRLIEAEDSQFILSVDGKIRWQGEVVASLSRGDDFYLPKVLLFNDDRWGVALIPQVLERLNAWVNKSIQTHLSNFMTMKADDTLLGDSQMLAQLLLEQFGIVKRKQFAKQIKQMDQQARVPLRQHHIRFGAFHIYLIHSLKPAPRLWLGALYMLRAQAQMDDVEVIEKLLGALASGRTSLKLAQEVSEQLCSICGFAQISEYAVRVDSLEKLGEFIRQSLSLSPVDGSKPQGYVDGKQFYISQDMLSFLGIDYEGLGKILTGLNYTSVSVPKSDVLPVVAPQVEVQVEDTVAATEQAETVAEVEQILLWSYQKKEPYFKKEHNEQRQDKSFKKPYPKKAKGGHGFKQGAVKKEYGERRETKPKFDENSPFAVLKDLKSKLG